MARWSEIITLIKTTPPKKKTNANGVPFPPKEESHIVFADKKPAWQSEFYNAQLNGIEVKFKIVIHRIDYAGEQLAEYEGKRYKILRTEESKNGEFIELTLSDLSERGGDLYG